MSECTCLSWQHHRWDCPVHGQAAADARAGTTAAMPVDAMNWRPIETAPRDETRIVLYRESWQEANAVGFWSESDKSWNAVGSTYFVGATHWMPLPAPPPRITEPHP